MFFSGGNNLQHQLDFVLTVHSTESVVVEENDSVSAGKTYYLADTLIQLAVDKGKREVSFTPGSVWYFYCLVYFFKILT